MSWWTPCSLAVPMISSEVAASQGYIHPSGPWSFGCASRYEQFNRRASRVLNNARVNFGYAIVSCTVLFAHKSHSPPVSLLSSLFFTCHATDPMHVSTSADIRVSRVHREYGKGGITVASMQQWNTQ